MMQSKRVLSFAGILWVTGIAWGMGILIDYEVSPGATEPAPGVWRDSELLVAAAHLPTLVMFVHPQCACSRASIGEFSEIIAHSNGKVTAYVLFFAPLTVDEDWVKTDLWKSASAIPGVTVIADVEAQEATRFDATVSGQVYLYDAEGALAYSGGITASRAHYGDNLGRSSVIASILGNQAAHHSNPVFGCELFERGMLEDNNFTP